MSALSRNFTLLIGALLIGSAVTCGAGVYGLTHLDDSFESVVSLDMPRLMTITDLRRRIRMLVVAENDHILEADPAKAKAIAADIKKGGAAVAELLAKYEPYLLPSDAQRYSALRNDVDQWIALDRQVLSLSEARRVAEATALSRTHSKQWEELIKTLIANADSHLKVTTQATERLASTARIAVIAVFAVSALLGLIAGLFIYRAIRRTMDEVVSLKDRLLAANEGLERTVAERTHTIRAILDHVHFGFFLVGRDLTITEGYTRSLAGLLGREELGGRRASECLGFTGAAAADFDARVEQIFDDILPEELNCDQVPARTEVGGRILRIQASAVRDNEGAVAQILFGVSDITELEAAERENRENQTLLRALKDPGPFRRFVADLNSRFGSVRDAIVSADQPRARRELHTIKGNASCYGLTDLATRAHAVEEHARIELPPVVDLEQEFETFLESNRDVLGIQRDGAVREVYRIDGEDLAQIESLLRDATDLDTLRRSVAERLDLLRWQPAARLLGPLDNQVASLGARFGKEVTLQVTGGDLRVLPSQVMPAVAVLPHLVRNAIDHGIEPRGLRGDKPPSGRLEIAFHDAGDAWQILVRDDGRGIDVDKLQERAVELGIVEAGAQLTHEQQCSLVFASRLSTAAEVSNVSGRGEGMGAVADAVDRVKGRIAVRSRRGIGTTIVLEVPKPAAARPA